MSKNNRKAGSFTLPLSIIGLTLLCLLYGIAACRYNYFPAPMVKRTLFAGEALLAKIKMNLDVEESKFKQNIYSPRRFSESGVTVYDKKAAYDGVTLVASGNESAARLIDMEGNVIHRWAKPFYEVWPNPEHIQLPVSEELIHWRRLILLPNGDLFVSYVGLSDTPYGYGMVKLDKDSNVIWKYSAQTHHDIYIGPGGNIFTLAHSFRFKATKGMKLIAIPLLEDFVVVLTPDGKEIDSFSVLEAFFRSDFSGHVYDITPKTHNDFDRFHVNSIKVLDEKTATFFPSAKKGQFLLSIRNMNIIAILDPVTRKITWAQRGFWYWQHDIDILENGRLLIFDNLGGWPLYGASRVIEFDPVTLEIFWEYHGTKERPLKSRIRASQQRLPNGSTLIVESDSGRILEVTKEKEIVWEYISPVRGGTNDRFQAVLTEGERYDRESLTFLLQKN